MSKTILELKEIEKSFYGVKALKQVNFSLREGEVHALVGGNGAGKSTLMKILTGMHSIDSGSIYLNGADVSKYHRLHQQNIQMIYQELSLIPSFTIAENIFLANEPLKLKCFIDQKQVRRYSKKLLAKLALDIDPYTPIRTLSVGQQQLVEIAKALSHNPKILIMDEPTASLSESETTVLFDIISKLKLSGVSIIYISHRMNEIFQIADQITVLKDGMNVMTDAAKNLTMEIVIDHMIGGEAENTFNWKDRNYNGPKSKILELQNLSIPYNNSRMEVSFSLSQGEVLGLAGLMGSGRTELIEGIFGIHPSSSGDIFISSNRVQIKNVGDAIRNKIVLVPEDRRRQGLVLLHNIADNLTLPSLSKLKKNLLLNKTQIKELVLRCIKKFDIKTVSSNKLIRLLSGGNQQKVVIAKWLEKEPSILLLDEPTAGIDIEAKAEILELIREFANKGRSVIIVSSELAELRAVCDRVLILQKGLIKKEFLHDELLSEEVLQYAIQ